MGRTLQSQTQTWMEEEKALLRFMRALRIEDQYAMRKLINLSRLHIAEASYAGNLYPMDAYIISMLLELCKQINTLEDRVNELCRKVGVKEARDPELPEAADLADLISRGEEQAKR